jgi:hypothetical protein
MRKTVKKRPKLLRMDADIDVAMKELRSLEHRNRELPSGLHDDLLKVLAKHGIGDYTKVPDITTARYLFECLNAMTTAFHRYIISVDYQRHHGKKQPLAPLKIRGMKAPTIAEPNLW